MANENQKLLMVLMKKSGNSECADCSSKCKCMLFACKHKKDRILANRINVAFQFNNKSVRKICFW